MTKFDKRIDDYIEKSAEFSKPILRHLRKLVHEANPDVEEKIKWGFAAFDYKGPMCTMASFKNHCVFGFWKSKLLHDPHGYLGERSNQGGESMGNLGRLVSLNDLPPDKILIEFIKQASKLNDEGVKVPAAPKKEKAELEIPPFFMEKLGKNREALATFEKFSLSNKREYVEWVNDSKTEETRMRRMESAIEWMAEGKVRNWKYQKK